ncbi:LysR substrate-binding domain-containing protein [Pseudomonas matsuisoli]|uniref:Transcriptional regulator n=1 Tax=Pseudomonas matsuisoli TaxID=1515666 RepID=A0A917V1K0_9PSED|nr:LysR substrate-binding domain-containing protein [Pseudomonas matsuisoli]GGK09021.1 transcriptional regulator [Pseudomonas matsuisoli]
MNLNYFAAFRAVMLAGTVSGAAHILGRSQPAVSRLLDKLEHELGVQLFERRKGLVTPTKNAHNLMAEVERAYLSMDSLRHSAMRLAKGQDPHVTVASMPALGIDFMPYVIAEFNRLEPDVKVTLSVQNSGRVEEYATAQQIDFGFVEMPYQTAGLRVDTFSTAPYVVAVPLAHPYAQRAALSLEDLAKTDFISYSNFAPARQLLDHVARSSGIEARYVYETNISVSALSMVKRGLGVAIIDPFTAMLHPLDQVKLVALTPAVPFRVSLLQPETRPGTPVTKVLLEVMWRLKDDVLRGLPV